MKKKILITVIAVAVTAGIIAGVVYFLNCRDNLSGEPQTPDLPVEDPMNPPDSVVVQGRKMITWDDVKWEGRQYADSEVESALAWLLENKVYPGDDDTYPLSHFLENTHPFHEHMMPVIKMQNQREVWMVQMPDPNLDMLSDIMNFAGRNNDQVLRSYKRYRPVIFRVLKSDMGAKVKAEKYIAMLQGTRPAFLTTEGNWHKRRLSDTHKFLREDRGWNRMEELKEYMESNDMLNTLSYGEGTDYTANEAYWAYSFWPRRYRENNIGAAMLILEDIKEFYVNGRKEGKDEFPPDVFNGEDLEMDELGNRYYHVNLAPWYRFSYSYDIDHLRTGIWKVQTISDQKYSWQMGKGLADGRFTWHYGEDLYEIVNYSKGMIEGINEKINYIWDMEKGINLSGHRYFMWKDNQLNGEYREVDENGHLIVLCNYVDGLHHGKYEEFYPSGQVKSTGTYEMGVLQERYVYHEDGEIFIEYGLDGKVIRRNDR